MGSGWKQQNYACSNQVQKDRRDNRSSAALTLPKACPVLHAPVVTANSPAVEGEEVLMRRTIAVRIDGLLARSSIGVALGEIVPRLRQRYESLRN